MHNHRAAILIRHPGKVGAKEALERADAVVYDALADEALLALAPPACTRHFVGKRSRPTLARHRCLHSFAPPTLSQIGHVFFNRAEVPAVFTGVTFRGRFYEVQLCVQSKGPPENHIL